MWLYFHSAVLGVNVEHDDSARYSPKIEDLDATITQHQPLPNDLENNAQILAWVSSADW